MCSLIGSSRAGEMLPGDYLDRLLRVPHPRAALVPQPVLVLPAYVQLLLLRRKSGRLLRCCSEPRGKWHLCPCKFPNYFVTLFVLFS